MFSPIAEIGKVNVGGVGQNVVLTPLNLALSLRFVDIYEVGEILWLQMT